MIEEFKNLWIEKYRPLNLNEIVLSKENLLLIEKFYQDKEIPNLLFIGNAGIGKTSLAKILVTDALGSQYLYINASDENGIDTIRTKVTGFSRVKSIDGSIKVIILDEVDGLTLDAQRALRNTMEEYSQYTRFILTANYNYKVIPALQSRCQSVDLVPPFDLCIDRVSSILESERIIVDESTLSTLREFVKTYYPDLRKVINEVQKGCVTGKLVFNKKKSNDVLIKGIFELIKQNNVLKARKLVIQNEISFNSDYNQLLKNLFNYTDEEVIRNKESCLLTISEYMYRMAFVMDPEINFYSCLIQLSSNISQALPNKRP
jgi:replication factor C small subunit